MSAATLVTSSDARVTDTVRIIDEPARVTSSDPAATTAELGAGARDPLIAPCQSPTATISPRARSRSRRAATSVRPRATAR